MKKGAEGKKPPPKMGTAHRYFQVADSGYFKFAMKKEEKTRADFFHGRYGLIRNTNPLFAETLAETKGQYLVNMPSREEVERAVNNGQFSATNRLAEQENTASKLRARAEIDNLKREHARISKELREIDVSISPNPFSREKALAAFDIAEVATLEVSRRCPKRPS